MKYSIHSWKVFAAFFVQLCVMKVFLIEWKFPPWGHRLKSACKVNFQHDATPELTQNGFKVKLREVKLKISEVLMMFALMYLIIFSETRKNSLLDSLSSSSETLKAMRTQHKAFFLRKIILCLSTSLFGIKVGGEILFRILRSSQ